MATRRRTGAAVYPVIAALVVGGCADVVQGAAVSVFHDPFNVGGLPASDGPSGLRADAPAPTRTVANTDGGPNDELASLSISDVEDFWEQAYAGSLPGTFRPVDQVMSWDAFGRSRQFCGSDTFTRVNAGFCPIDNTIGWDRGTLLPQLETAFGEMAVTWMLAHEYGHSIQRQARLITRSTPVLVSEQQADCLSGVYLSWVAKGNSKRFTVNTSDGLNNVLAAMIAFRDPLFSEEQFDVGVDEHGTAFERISAFQFGFTEGARACAAIDEAEIAQRRGDLPVALQEDRDGDLPVTAESALAIVEALTSLAAPTSAPEVTFDASVAGSCPDSRPSPPVSYCPDTNTIAVDLPALQEMGAGDDNDITGLSLGDATAYSVLMSRYMLALQRERGGLILDNAAASLRTACLTGVATSMLTEQITTSDGTTIELAAGDLDEVVSGILTNGMVASDVNGDTVPSGFSRIEAFRSGVLGDIESCLARNP